MGLLRADIFGVKPVVSTQGHMHMQCICRLPRLAEAGGGPWRLLAAACALLLPWSRRPAVAREE